MTPPTDVSAGTGSDAAAASGTASSGRAGLGARIAFAVTLSVLAATVVIAARSQPAPASDGGDRLTRRVELIELIAAEQARTEELAAEADRLAEDVAEFEAAMEAGALGGLQEEVDAVAGFAGLTPVRGPGLVVTLTDSVMVSSPEDDPNNYLIHEQDLQAIINALWAGGAEAMSVNNQRVLATTAIRCVGNTLLLHGQVYMPPYEIAAIGDVTTLQDALERDPAVREFRAAAEQYELGYGVAVEDELDVDAFEGVPPLSVASPAGADL